MKVQIQNFSEPCNLNLHSVVLTILPSIHSLIYFRALCCTDNINQYSFLILFPLLKTVKQQFDFPSRKYNQFFITEKRFSIEMTTLRNKRKLATLHKENCEEHPRSNLAQNSNVPRSQGDYITQFLRKLREESLNSCR